MKFKPLHDQIVVKRKEEELKTSGGLYIPDTAKEKSIQGEVLAVGPGRYLETGELLPLTVKAGDVILFQKHAYVEIKIDNADYLIIREDNILGILTDE